MAMQEETILFSKREYTIEMDGQIFHGDTLFTGDDVLIKMAKGSAETVLFKLRETVDNESEVINLAGKTVNFVGKQYVTSLDEDDGVVAKEWAIGATVISAPDGEVTVTFTATLTNTAGLYYCYMIIDGQYNDHRFEIEIFDPKA